MEGLIILLPVYNDWNSLNLLLADLHQAFRNDSSQIVVVNDGSTEPTVLNTKQPVKLINLTQNLGHQKAIAIGLSYIHENMEGSRVLIMDADGNDLPAEAWTLSKLSVENPSRIIMARRSRRNEGILFRCMYFLYLNFFRLLSGRKIRYGNFCVIPFSQLGTIVHLHNLWLHLPAAIIKSNIPYFETATRKGERLDGRSKMSLTSLFMHGLGAIAVFTDIIAIRLLMATGIAIFISLLSLLMVVIIRLATDLAVPGWASAIGLSLIIIILVAFVMSLFLVFTYILAQSSRKFIPAIHYKDYVAK